MKLFASNNIYFFLRNLLFLALGVLILYLVFRGVDTTKVINQLKGVNYWWLIFPKIFSTIAHFLRALRWRLVLNTLGYYPSKLNTFFAVLTAYFTNLGLPKLGDFFRCWALKRTDEIPLNVSLGSVIVERSIDFLTLFGLLFGVLIAKFEMVGNFIMNNIIENIASKSSHFITEYQITLIVLLILAISGLFILFIFRRAFRQTFLYQKTKSFFKGIWEGILALVRMENKWKFLVMTFFMWVLYYLHFQFMFQSLAATSEISAGNGLFVFTVSGFGMAAPIQAGIGAYHWIVSEGLQVLGYLEDVSLAFAVATHGAGVIYKLLMGAFALVFILVTTGKVIIKERKAIIKE